MDQHQPPEINDLRILLLEDVSSDAELEEIKLRDAKLEFTMLRVGTREAFMQALDEFQPDIVLADYKLPGYSGRDALEYTRRTHPQIPVIMVTGAMGDETAVELLKLGARDYVLKDRLARLAPAIKRALSEECGIRARKAAEKALRQSEERYRSIFESARDVILTLVTDGILTALSPSFEQITGWARDEWLGKSFAPLIHPDDLPVAMHLLQRAMKGEALPTFELRFLKKSGGYLSGEVTIAALAHDGEITQLLGIARDITERKITEDMLRRNNRTLRTLSAGNIALVKAVDVPQLLDTVCGVIVEKGEYRMAWVGYAEDDEAKSIIPMACRGVEKSDLISLQLTWADAARGQSALARAIRSGQMQISRDIQKNPNFEIYQQLAVAHGWHANLAVPLSDEKRVFGALSIFSTDPDAFDAGEVALLNELGGDLAYGINALRTRSERDRALEKNRQHLEELRENLEETIQAIAATVEMRDPYTAGHEKRVAGLAVAIGQELGMAKEQLEGLRIAGNVHDVGKVKIPAEILSKPGALSDIESSMIKLHPETGYEILRSINFPWPIATIVWQHHERLDGSGYPRGLKGDEILLEAQVLSVADVVESIVSHRPYRSALGLDAALKEIVDNRSKLYNADAVDACVRLFREKRFIFP